MSQTIDYYYSHLSPFAYLGHGEFLNLVNRHKVHVNYRPVNLLDVFAGTGGLPLGKRHLARIAYREIELKRWSAKRNLTLNVQAKYFPTNPQLADCAAIVITKAGGNVGKFSSLTFDAIWAKDKDISSVDTVHELIKSSGNDTSTIMDGIPAVISDYHANTKMAIEGNVIGAPAFVLNGELFWGQDRLTLLDDALATSRSPYLAQL